MNKFTALIRFLCAVIFISGCLSVQAQNHINGVVRDFETNELLAGVNIISKNSNTITNEHGQFHIDKGADTLILSHVGYLTSTIVASSLAKNENVYLKPLNFQLDQVIVNSGILSHKLIEMPASVSLLSKNSIEQSVGLSYVEKLNEVPGVFVHSGTLNTNRITIRGVGSRNAYGSNRIKAYLDGIPITTGDGSTEIEDINSGVINSIELLKGSKSAMYGSGLGGVILISSIQPVQDGFHVKTNFKTGSFNMINPGAGFQFKKKNFTIAANYTYIQTDGWRQNNKYLRHNLNLISKYSTQKSNTSIIAQFIKTKAEIPSSLNKQTFENSPDSAAQNWLAINGFEDYAKLVAGINHDRKLTESLSNSSTIFASVYEGYESRPFNILDDKSYKLGVRNILALGFSKLKIKTGFEMQFEKYEWSIYETLAGTKGTQKSRFAEKRQPISLFYIMEYQTNGNAIIETGLSYNFLSYKLIDRFDPVDDLSGNYSYKPILMPFVGVNIPIKDQWHFYSSVSRGFSAPSVEETLLPDGEINPDLKPETGFNIESGIRWKPLSGIFYTDACLYTIWLSDLLVTERESEAVFYGKNAGKTWHKGIEITSMLHLNKQEKFKLPQLNFNISYQYSHYTFTHFIDDGIDYTNKALPGIPDQNLWLSGTLKYKIGFYLAMQFQYVGSQFLSDANTIVYPSYSLTHLKIGYNHNEKRGLNYNFSLGIKNLFDMHYASMILVNAPSFGSAAPRYYYPGEPRTYFLSVSFGF